MAGWTKVSGVNGSASQTTLVLGSVPAGSLIRVTAYGGSNTLTCSDGSGDTGASSYTVAKTQANTGDGGFLYEFYLYPTVNTASRTVTVSASEHVVASWFTPPTGTTSVAVPATNSATTVGGQTTIDSGTVTASLGDLVAGAADNSNSQAVNWTAGGTTAGGTWATDQTSSETAHVVYTQFVVATAGGLFSASPVYGTSDQLASIVAVYRATVSAGAAPFRPVVSRLQAVNTAASW